MYTLKRMLFACILLFCAAVMSVAQNDDAAAKMSSSLRVLALVDGHVGGGVRRVTPVPSARRVCALVRIAGGDDSVLTEHGCKPVANIGDIAVAEIPVANLVALASDSRVCRVEAERGNELQLDSMATYTNASGIYIGRHLPQPYTGKGVVVGSMDVGYDLTHPTFLNADGTASRICRFWDQLSADTIGSQMYVGAEYTSAEAISGYAHSRDGFKMFHGTHTLGIAAGNGAGTPYVGMAPESELCLVSNAVSGDEEFISDSDMYKYTTAADLLGFKYIFDYAESVGKPCVVSFSEGARQDFRGDNQLYYEALSRLVGKGRILVASAGNEGINRSHVCKPVGRESAGTLVTSPDNHVSMTVRVSGDGNSKNNVSMLTVLGYGAKQVVISVPVGDVCAAVDSLLSDTLLLNGIEYVQTMQAYRSCFNADDIVVDVTLSSPDSTWLWTNDHKTSFSVCGADAFAEVYPVHGSFSADATLNDADFTHNILSPGSAPDVICVGATSYRPQYTDISGSLHTSSWGPSGERGSFSSVGPTFDGRVKPDVMAPGANVISAMSSYYVNDNKDKALVAQQEYGGRTYGWAVEGGTSMSTPAVAGIIALWLEANPDLTPADVLGVMQRTCKPCGDYGDDTPYYCGYGAIDAYAGLLDVLGMTGVEGLSASSARGVGISVADGNCLHLSFDAPLQHDERVSVYGVGGNRCATLTLGKGQREYSVRLAVGNGVYAVQVGRQGSALVKINQ